MPTPTSRFCIWFLISLAIIVGTGRGAAQMPSTLLQSFYHPGTNAQTGANQGYAVALDGDYAVVGAPYASAAGHASGVVKVYDAATGALRYRLPNPNPAEQDYFGQSVAVSGTCLVVGAYGHDFGATNAGIAYIYDFASPNPTIPITTLTNPSPVADDGFGYAVAVSGTRIAITACGDLLRASGGKAYIYDLANSTSAIPVLILTNPVPGWSGNFGVSVAISGNWLAVGRHWEIPGNDSAPGRAYVYDLGNSTSGMPLVTLSNPKSTPGDYFGSSLAMSATYLVVGSSGDETGGYAKGCACVYTFSNITSSLPAVTLTNPNPVFVAHFGQGVAISGSRVVVGAPFDGTMETNEGTAFVYDLSAATPNLPVVTLTNPTPAPEDWFGYAVAISGATVLAGASGDDTVATNAGGAYLYHLDSATPASPIATLADPEPSAFDQFGYTAAISGSRVVVGAPWDDTGAVDSGIVCIYDLASPHPAETVLKLTSPNPAQWNWFGIAVAISGTRVVVGEIGGYNSGKVYVYELANFTPTVPVVTLTSSNAGYDTYFGWAVAISGSRVVVGAYGDDTGASMAGKAYVYDVASTTPTLPLVILTNPSPGALEFFGRSVAISGGRVVVGAPFDDTAGYLAGIAYLYDLTSATPNIPAATLTNPNPATSKFFGGAVAISGTRVVIGADQDVGGANNIGSAYVYDLASPTPMVPVLTMRHPSPHAYDSFGSAVAISGNWVVVGTRFDDSAASHAGAVYIFDLTSPSPAVPVATLTRPVPTAGDNFGYCVAIDGTSVLAGAPYVDTTAADRGAAYVFGLGPQLRISPSAPGFVMLSWPALNASGFVLQSNESLGPASWHEAPSGANNPVIIPATNTSGFYRLFRP